MRAKKNFDLHEHRYVENKLIIYWWLGEISSLEVVCYKSEDDDAQGEEWLDDHTKDSTFGGSNQFIAYRSVAFGLQEMQIIRSFTFKKISDLADYAQKWLMMNGLLKKDCLT